MRTPEPTESILQPSHPSYGCTQAWFVFGVLNPAGDITRVLIVEAKNIWAVQTLERVSNKDNRVNDHCELMTVGRQCASLGTRSDRAVEVSYVDFLIDIVEPHRLVEDHYIATTFDRSLTDADRAYAAKKLEALEKQSRVPEQVPEQSIPDLTEAELEALYDEDAKQQAEQSAAPVMNKFLSDHYSIQTSSTHHRVTAALLDLGFKKQQIGQVMGEIDASGTVENTVKLALQQLNVR